MERIVFGPVPSRRFGQSLGINNIFLPKRCSYNCVYCQVGKTKNFEIERREFFSVDEIKRQVKNVIESLRDKKIDYISFVPDGEPTLDINLGKEIDALKEFGIKIAVITNSSLIWRNDVREDLKRADCVSLKVDCVSEDVWKKLNRPHGKLKIKDILDGIEIFSKEYKGRLLTETLFVKDINDDEGEIEKIGNFLKKVNPEIAYIGYPERPPSEKWVKIPEKEKIDFAYIVFKNKGINVSFMEKKGESFGFTGNLREDILSILSVHPMSKSEVEKFLNENGGSFYLIEDMVKKGIVEEIDYMGEKYYRRALK